MGLIPQESGLSLINSKSKKNYISPKIFEPGSSHSTNMASDAPLPPRKRDDILRADTKRRRIDQCGSHEESSIDLDEVVTTLNHPGLLQQVNDIIELLHIKRTDLDEMMTMMLHHPGLLQQVRDIIESLDPFFVTGRIRHSHVAAAVQQLLDDSNSQPNTKKAHPAMPAKPEDELYLLNAIAARDDQPPLRTAACAKHIVYIMSPNLDNKQRKEVLKAFKMTLNRPLISGLELLEEVTPIIDSLQSYIVAAVKPKKTATLDSVLSSCDLEDYTDKVAEQFFNLQTLQQMFKKNQILCETALKEVGLVAHQVFIFEEKLEALGLFQFEK